MNDDWKESAKTALLFAWLAITICAYYLLRPVRMAMVMDDFGPAMLPWVYMGTALCTGVAVWIYSKFTHLPRRRLIGGVLGFFLSNFVGIYFLVKSGARWVSPVLYVWTDIFSVMSVTVFWVYANDVSGGKEAKKSFGMIGSAGFVGAFIGASLAKVLVGHVSDAAFELIGAAVYSLTLACMGGLESLTGGKSAKREKMMESFDRMDFGGLRSTVQSVLSSRMLSLLVVLVCFERFVPDFVDFIFSSAMHASFPDRTAFAGTFATFQMWENGLTFLAAFFLTSHVLKRFGVHVGLTAVPASIALIGGLYALAPVLAVAMAMKGFEQGQRHAWFKAGKEVIYTATNKEVIYKIKAYLDMFVYRFARGLSGLLLLLLTTVLGFSPRGVSIVMILFALAWGWVTWTIGTDYETLDRDEPAKEAGSSLLKTAAV